MFWVSVFSLKRTVRIKNGSKVRTVVDWLISWVFWLNSQFFRWVINMSWLDVSGAWNIDGIYWVMMTMFGIQRLFLWLWPVWFLNFRGSKHRRGWNSIRVSGLSNETLLLNIQILGHLSDSLLMRGKLLRNLSLILGLSSTHSMRSDSLSLRFFFKFDFLIESELDASRSKLLFKKP